MPTPAVDRARARLRGRGQVGSATLELVVIFPVVLLLIFGIVQAAVYYHGRTLAMLAAQDGLRTAQALDGTAAAGKAQTTAALNGNGATGFLTTPTVTVTRTPTQSHRHHHRPIPGPTPRHRDPAHPTRHRPRRTHPRGHTMTPHHPHPRRSCGRGPAAHRMHQRPHPGSQRHPRPLGIGVRLGQCQPDSVGVTVLDPVRGQAAGRRRGHRRGPGLRADVLRPARRPRALPQRPSTTSSRNPSSTSTCATSSNDRGRRRDGDRVHRPSDHRLGRRRSRSTSRATRPPSPSLVCVDKTATSGTYKGKP